MRTRGARDAVVVVANEDMNEEGSSRDLNRNQTNGTDELKLHMNEQFQQTDQFAEEIKFIVRVVMMIPVT